MCNFNYYLCSLKKNELLILALGDMTKWNKMLVLIVMISLVGKQHIIAQYLYDFGFGGGVSGYTGDVTRNPLSSPGYVLGAFYRSNIDSRFAVSVGVEYAKISATSDPSVVFPGASGLSSYSFDASYKGADVLMEVNFFPYPKQKKVANSKNLTPYAFLGVGYKQFSTTGGGEGTTTAFPVGVGARWLLGKQWGIQLQFKSQKWMDDSLDEGKDAPFAFDTDALHMKDWIYSTTFMVTYSFGEDIWDCNCPGGYKRKRARVQ